MLLVPGAIIALIGAHLYLVVKLGTTAPPWLRARSRSAASPVASSRPAPTASTRPGQRVNAAEKEAYLREYEMLKKKGKPFFPYAVFKDSAMMLIVAVVIDRDVADPRRRAGPEGRPDDDHLRAAAGVVLLLPLRAAARDQAERAGPGRDDRDPDPVHGPAAAAAVLRPQPGAAAVAAAGRDDRGHHDDRRDGLPDLPRRLGRLADRDRPEVAPQFEAGKEVAAQSGCLACHKFGENGNDGPGPGADPHRRQAARARRSSARSRSAPGSCPPTATCRRRSSTSWSTSCRRSTSEPTGRTVAGPGARALRR